MLFVAILVTVPSSSTAQPRAMLIPGGNSITITVDTSKKGKITASGTFTTAENVTLTRVVVYSYQENGGILAAPIEVKGAGIDNTKMTWGPGTSDVRVYKGSYAIRADGEFSDMNNVSSGYAIAGTDGDLPPADNLTLEWNAGSPTSPASKQISCAGTWKGNPAPDGAGIKNGYLTAIPLTGGKQSTTVMKLTLQEFARPWVGDPSITVPEGGIMYSVIGQANDNGAGGGQTFGTPYRSLQVQP